MKQFLIVFALIGIAFLALTKADENVEFDLNSSIEFVSAKNVSEYLADHPRMKLLQSLERDETYGQIRYTIGRRVNNDRLVAQASNSHQWSTPQDLTLRLIYPVNGQGAIVSFAQITVDQSTNVGRAYVVSGGVGQRSIVIFVEASNTLYFRYVGQIYGV